jgi:hypothetical protein
MASLQKRTEDDDSGDYLGDMLLMKGTQSRAENPSSAEASKPVDNERLSIIQDEKENTLQKQSVESLRGAANGTISPAGTLHRLATMQANKSWSHDGQRIITPPLRTSSANQHRTAAPRTTVRETQASIVDEEKENFKARQIFIASQSTASTSKESLVQKLGKKAKGRQLVAEALSFFR